MTIEETLASIDTSLKGILTALLSGSAAVAQLGTPEARTEPAKAGKAGKAAVAKEKDGTEATLPGDAEGTIYYMTSDEREFYKQAPGETKPAVAHLMPVSAAYWKGKKEQLAKNASSAAAAQGTVADTAPTATATPAAASKTSQDDVTFETVVTEITALSKNTGPKGGRAGVMAILSQFLPGAVGPDLKVPKLQALGRNADILAAIRAAAAAKPEPEPEAEVDNDDPFA